MHLHQDDPIDHYRRRSGDGATPACTQPCMSGVICVHYACNYIKWFTEKHILSCHLHPIIFTIIIQPIHPTMSTPNAPIDRPSTPASAQTPPSYPTVHGVSFSLPPSSARVPPQSINDDASESAHRYNCIDHVAAAIARSVVDSPQAASILLAIINLKRSIISPPTTTPTSFSLDGPQTANLSCRLQSGYLSLLCIDEAHSIEQSGHTQQQQPLIHNSNSNQSVTATSNNPKRQQQPIRYSNSNQYATASNTQQQPIRNNNPSAPATNPQQ